jgi:RNA polymerase sigma-70 factor (ECF subfamily)
MLQQHGPENSGRAMNRKMARPPDCRPKAPDCRPKANLTTSSLSKRNRSPVRSSLRVALIGEIPKLRVVAVFLCRDRTHADDLVQETLVKAWDKFDSFQEGTNLSAWLIAILRNNFLSERRKRRREVEDGEGKFAGRLAVRPDQPGHMDLMDLRDAMTRLPEAQCTALLLVAASGLSYEEAAEACGCAVGTIKSRVNRARTRLVELLRLPMRSFAGVDGREFRSAQNA